MNKYNNYEGLKELIFNVAYKFWHATNLPYEVEGADHAYLAVEEILCYANLDQEFRKYIEIRRKAGRAAYAKYIEEKNSNENKNESE